MILFFLFTYSFNKQNHSTYSVSTLWQALFQGR